MTIDTQRAALIAAVAVCGYCEKPSDALVTYSDGLSICLACREREQERVEVAFREAYGPNYDKLAAHQAEGR